MTISHKYADILPVLRDERLALIFQGICHFTLKERKQGILLCRSRSWPSFGKVHDMTADFRNAMIRLSASSHWRSLEVGTTVDYIRDTFTPFRYALLLSLLLSAPYTPEESEQIRLDMIRKEVDVMERRRPDDCVDWFGIISSDCVPLSNLDPNPFVTDFIRDKIDSWCRSLSTQVIYPKPGNKLLSDSSNANVIDMLGDDTYQFHQFTTTDLEAIYARTGLKCEGPCEMKQRWYPTGATPRTYFAQGASAYNTSKFLRDPFNMLCDQIRPTARWTRVSPSLIFVQEEEDVVIYDLTSFTSMFHEHFSFLRFLSIYTRECTVRIFDGWHGICEVSLGDLIGDYISSNILQPSYSTKLAGDSDSYYHHNIAGFLGVYGNLATCTFPHGCLLSFVVGSTRKAWCAGDDAGGATTDPNWVLDHAEVLGAIAREKTFLASDPGAIALKRPILLHLGHLFTKRNILFPVLGTVFGDDRFREPDDDIRFRFARSVVPFLRSCQNFDFSDADISLLTHILRVIYQWLGLPADGYLPQIFNRPRFPMCVPIIDRDCIYWDPLERLVNLYYPGHYTPPLVEDIEEVLPSCLGQSVISNLSKHGRYLRKIGFLKTVLLRTFLQGDEGKGYLLSEVTGQLKKFSSFTYVYEITCIQDIPLHLLQD